MNVRTGGGAVALRRGLAATSRMLILLLLSHRRRERSADQILVLSGIVPAGGALWSEARRGYGTCACSRQFDGLMSQNQLRLRAFHDRFRS